MKRQLSDRYEPSSVESKWISLWEESQVFWNPPLRNESFSIVIPPPNVTGNLHIGHALEHTIIDVMVRIERKKGKQTVWVPGMDHAGIATQMVVTKELAKQNISIQDLSREEFEKKTWEWKEKSGGMITKQQRLLGESVDWSRERFTMDQGLSKAVLRVFRTLYDQGLIYRGEKIINWCPVTKTAISDIEVEYKEKQGKLYHIRYPKKSTWENNPDPRTWTPKDYVVVATTRPETMLGDVAVCANPADNRYSELQSTTLVLPLVNREIPLLYDSFVDPAFGSGLVKITPAHDPNDFEAGQRLGLKPILILNLDGTMNANALHYAGMDRFEARKAIVADLVSKGYLEKEENHTHSVGHNQRGGAVIEPLLSTQWFVKIAPLAEPAIQAVKSGQIVFQPKMWEKTYFEWMENIRDWCISRQLWWGHRIPAYYDSTGDFVVAETKEEAVALFEKKGKSYRIEELVQDPDVLDTWFSSALWPFTVFGWPEKSEDLARFYPTSILVTGFDIIFFWVARMIMMGIKFMGDVPFRKVLIHGLVRDKDGKKFSKSMGNVIDPLDMMAKYGTDSFRFFLAAVLPEGKDILFDESRLDGYRSFCNKIWNSSRFIFMNLPENFQIQPLDINQLNDSDIWILREFDETLEKYQKAYSEYHFFEMASLIYEFIWGSFCDWYLEFTKSRIYAKEGATEGELQSGFWARQVLAQVLDKALGLLNPFMPFITEEIHSFLNPDLLASSPFPTPFRIDPQHMSVLRMREFQESVSKIRNMRAELGVKPEKKCKVIIKTNQTSFLSILELEKKSFLQFVKADSVEVISNYNADPSDASGAVSFGEIYLPLAGILDFEKERQRLTKELQSIQNEMAKLSNKLENAEFLEKAKPEVIAKEREKFSVWKEKSVATLRALEKLP